MVENLEHASHGDSRRSGGGKILDVSHEHQGERTVSSRVKLNGIYTSMEVDTGAAATIINKETYKRISKGN